MGQVVPVYFRFLGDSENLAVLILKLKKQSFILVLGNPQSHISELHSHYLNTGSTLLVVVYC